jgi:hypothetical protein
LGEVSLVTTQSREGNIYKKQNRKTKKGRDEKRDDMMTASSTHRHETPSSHLTAGAAAAKYPAGCYFFFTAGAFLFCSVTARVLGALICL